MNLQKEINQNLSTALSDQNSLEKVSEFWIQTMQELDKCNSARDVLDMQINMSSLKMYVETVLNSLINRTTTSSYAKHLLHKDKDNKYDIFLIDWDKDSISKYHDHANGGCAMFVLKGVLFESRISSKFGNVNSFLTEGTISYIDNDIGYHKIKAHDHSLSLHIYFPGGFQTNYFKMLN